MSLPQSEDAINVSSIIFAVRQQFGKTVDRIIFETETGSYKREIAVEVSPGREHKEAFWSALKLSPRDQLIVSMQCQSQQGGVIIVDLSKVMIDAQDVGGGMKKYVKSHGDIQVTINIPYYSTPSERPDHVLSPSNDILSVCPRFRVLVIGNSGAGKSTLIKQLFGVEGVDVSDYQRGEADINREFLATNGMPFVLHDSLGFEPGDYAKLEQVKAFVKDRRERKNFADRLHAVWVCLAVPYAKGRFTEYGTQQFLLHRNDILGDIPVIVALTQLDLLDKMMIMRVRAEGNLVRSVEQAKPFIVPRRDHFLSEWCTQPLLRMTGDGASIPHVAVSTEKRFGLEPTLTELMNVTISKIEQHIKAESYAAQARIKH